jgi:hypothetical protein
MYQATREAFREQVLRGMPMGGGYYLKAFPVWFARRGNYGVLLSQANALSSAAHVRGDWTAADLAQKQLQWVVGRNPFVQSTMYGEGYDFTQQYSVSSGDIVGSLPVGMETRGSGDEPYWPAQNCYVYKEVWVHSTSRWLWLMEDLAGPALVEGRVAAGGPAKVEILDNTTGQVLSAAPDGNSGSFRAYVPDGKYTVRSGSQHTNLTALPGGIYRLDLRPGHGLEFDVKAVAGAGGAIEIRLSASGSGRHGFELRTENLDVDSARHELLLQPGSKSTLTWKARSTSAHQPWVAVVVPDDEVSRSRDLVGSNP